MLEKIKDIEALIICSNEKKELLLKEIEKKKELYNIKFMTLNEFKNEYFYKYNVTIYPYMMEKYNISFSTCKEYLDNMYYIDLDKDYESVKIELLKKIKKDLVDNNYLIFNNRFDKFLKRKKIFIDYDILDPCMINIFKKYNSEFINKKEEEKILEVYPYNDIEEEVNNVILKIIDLINKNVSLNNIYLTNVDKEYYYILKKLFKLYNIPLELNENISINSSLFVQEYFSLKKIPELTNENKEVVEKFINLLNKYVEINDSKYYKSIIKEELKTTYIKNKRYKESIKVKDFEQLEINDNSYLFVLGFNEGSLPKLVKDEDFLSDIDKKELGIITSNEMNTLKRKSVYKKLTRIKNINISYKHHGFSEETYKSSMIEDYDMKEINDIKESYTNSDNYNIRKQAIMLDNFNKYKEENINLNKLINTYGNKKYNTYNHLFTGILKENNRELKLSYTSLNSYNLCPFSYYIKYILKIDPFEETFEAFVGNLYHYIFSVCYKENFDFEETFNNYIEKRILTPKENFLLKRLKKELILIVQALKEQKMYTDFKESYCEKMIELKITDNVTFKGIIDKLMYYKNLNDTYYAVVDYKTGSFPTSLNNMKYGLDMQLAIYIYLIEKSNIFENPIFTGAYFQKTLLGNIKKNGKKLEEVILDSLKLRGYSTDDEIILSSFDHEYTKSKIISGMSVTDKGFSRYAKTLDSESVLNLVEYTDKIIKETATNIQKNKFNISPVVIEKEEKACKFCKFRDLCYKDINDNKELEKVTDLSFLGGEE